MPGADDIGGQEGNNGERLPSHAKPGHLLQATSKPAPLRRRAGTAKNTQE